jgi:hypothetical protein
MSRLTLLAAALGGLMLSTITAAADRHPGQTAADVIEAAPGVQARLLTRAAADWTDMLALWPPGPVPSHLISCVEGRRGTLGDGRLNPSVQAIALHDGAVRTLVRGMDRCDGIRVTPWGTVVATEESSDGGLYELRLPADPAAWAELTVRDRAAGRIEMAAGGPAADMVKRTALPVMAWEGLEVLPSGVVYGGDEWGPFTDGQGKTWRGGGLFKFLPARPREGGAPLVRLADSPLAQGRVFALAPRCASPEPRLARACEGRAGWVEVAAAQVRVEAEAKQAGAWFRPEDLHLDPAHTGPGVRFCWANTGAARHGHFGEVVCASDSAPLQTQGEPVQLQLALQGHMGFNQFDNLEYSRDGRALYVLEDRRAGGVWRCARQPDGSFTACVRLLTVLDAGAEPTGFLLHPDGRRAWLSIQHSQDEAMPAVDGYGTDDVLELNLPPP